MRATARQISFADWELMRQGDRGVRLEPLLEAISAFLDDQRDVIECIRRDLVRGLKQPGSGRHGLTATQVLRSLVLMRLKNWDYRELRERIADGLTLRQFTDFLWDVVRVITRLVRRLAKALELRRIKGFCDRTRSARRRMYEIQRLWRQTDEAALEGIVFRDRRAVGNVLSVG